MLEAGLRLPGVERGTACEGTALQSDTLKVNGRAFLFLSPKKAYLKLAGSVPEAQKAARLSPAVVPGGAGWTSLLWDAPCPVGAAVLRRWVAESHALIAKAPVQTLSAGLLAMKPKPRDTAVATRAKADSHQPVKAKARSGAAKAASSGPLTRPSAK
jgi:hypothetical protein